MSTTRRAYGNNKRPLSAIFLGSASSSSINTTISTSSSIPDLPEPPSPGAASNLSSTSSGLPSPPATNSTGSGSVGGDSHSNTAGSLRRRPTLNQSASNRSMNNTNGDGSRGSIDDPHDESGEYDEDQTAKFGAGKRKSTISTTSASSNDTVSALDRVKNLAKRNQEALEKLSGMRLSSPSPAFGRSARSPIPPSTSSTVSSTSTSSRLSDGSRPRVVSQATTSTYGVKEPTPSGSDTERESQDEDEFVERVVTPPPVTRVRQRLLSAPDSPSKLRNSISVVQRPLPLSPRSKRTSSGMNSVSDAGVRDVTNAALAAVASSRTSPTGRRSRQPLPQEFRQDSNSMDPTTPHRSKSVKVSDPSSSTSGPPSVSPRLFRNSIRSATMRDVSTRKTFRSVSEDISGQVIDEQGASEYGTTQTRRGGSWESPVAQNRTLVGEGLKAAGIATRRRETTGDVFRESEERRLELVTTTGRTSVLRGRDREADHDPEPRTPSSAVRREPPRSLLSSRPMSSMGGASHESPSSDALRVSTLKGKKSTPLMDIDRDLPVIRQLSMDRGNSSPYTGGVSRQLTGTPLSGTRDRVTSGEHGRLMMDSLSIFESNLSRLPPNGHTTTNTIPELFKAAQTIVQATDKLNVLLRNGTNRALEEQISAEVSGELGEGNSELSEYWRTVGSDFRECLRASDDLVRNMTGFLLGVGKVLRETNASNVGTPSQHLRSISLDDDVTARLNTEGAPTSGGRSSEGRRSVAGSRYSWEARLERPMSYDGSRDRPSSSFRDRRNEETPPQATASQTSNLSSGSSSIRRFLTPREARDSPRSSTEEVAMEPSPSPAARVYGPQSGPQSIRALPPLVVPRPLPGLPPPSSDSESSLARKKVSNGSVNTVRGIGQTTTFQPTVPTSTTALSFQNLIRTNSGGGSPAVTFSRPPTISVFALNGLRQREREQRSRESSAAYNNNDSESGGTGTGSSQMVNSPVSAAESEFRRERSGTLVRNRTVGKTVRMSLDGGVSGGNGGVDHQSATTRGAGGSSTTRVKKTERRRTITEIFSGH
ncbi:hypothetical protein BDM02DRAFT_3188590 [Thelephora ganbajun]|uniref:Uncharacterized protein n=1 Tax=Thelephora ganbajun TaxID=370292 RepID=A0ACB6ZBK8_THEGA|nr:hypothetical protein BDM02DRAFT_3188590 [Thelephora ganbajun]